MSDHIDGEEEQCAVLIGQATMQIARDTKKPVAPHLREMIAWLVREAFRRGYRHAHERRSVKASPWPDDEVTPTVESADEG